MAGCNTVTVVGNSPTEIIEVKSGDFCSGWSDGYKAGWCYLKSGCYCNYVPYCPTPIYPQSQSSYSDGFESGFLQGKNDNN